MRPATFPIIAGLLLAAPAPRLSAAPVTARRPPASTSASVSAFASAIATAPLAAVDTAAAPPAASAPDVAPAGAAATAPPVGIDAASRGTTADAPGAGMRAAGIPSDKARAALNDVLQRREFRHGDEQRWREMMQRWMQEQLSALFKRFGGRAPAMTAIAEALAWAAAVAALLALAVMLFRLQRPRRDRDAWDGLNVPAPRLSSREWAARAADALRAGDTREAIRCGYHAALFRLEEQGVWRVDDARTPREYLALLSPADERRPPLADLTRAFEQSWYGSRTADARGALRHLEVLGCPAPLEPTT